MRTNLIVSQRSSGWVRAIADSSLHIDIRLVGQYDTAWVVITLGIAASDHGDNPTVAERAELPVILEHGRVRVGYAYVEWNEVPMVNMGFLPAGQRRHAHEALWLAYQSFLQATSETLERIAKR